jgi:hypothetical protein
MNREIRASQQSSNYLTIFIYTPSESMKRALTLAIWLVPSLALLIPTAAGADPLLNCINAAIIQLDGVPRSDITASLDESQSGSQLVNWQARNGSSGFCQMGETGEVAQVRVEVAVEQPHSVRALTPAVSGAAAGSPVWVSTTAGAVNLRSAPGGEIVGSAANGSELTVTGKTDGEWVEVTGGKWVSQYLLITFNPALISASSSAGSTDAAASPTPSVSARSAQVITEGGGINVRRSPGGEVLYGLADGVTVTLTGNREGGWAELQDGGWVSEDYLQ